MKEFNSPFFGLYEHVFIEYSELYGVPHALYFFEKLFARALGKAYKAMSFSRGDVKDFARIVKERDESVGLAVALPLVTNHELDRTYINFKINFLLGEEWSYHTTQHIWDGASYTEHVISQL